MLVRLRSDDLGIAIAPAFESCMVYAERAETAAVSCGTSHVTTKQRCNYTTSEDTQKCAIDQAMFTHLESHAIRVQWVCLRVENSAI